MKKANLLKTIASCCFCVVINAVSIAQQNVQFTQYMFNGLVINPAYAGADEALSLTFIHRSQWTGLDNAPSTQTLTAHTLIKEKKTGVGLTLVNDHVGIHKTLNALGSYAYHLRTGKNSYLSMGLQAGIRNVRNDYTSLMNGTTDPAAMNAYTARTFFDFGAGIYFRSPRLHAGLSVPEINTQRFYANDSLMKRFNPSNILLYGKYRIPLSDQITLEPSTLLKYLKGLPLSYDINMNLVYREVLTMGLSYRAKESVDFIFKANVTRQLQFGYAYDHPIGSVARVSNGSHELMIQYVFRHFQKNVESPRG
jgi:type IX secretion system PorP/SprF family membrane protein